MQKKILIIFLFLVLIGFVRAQEIKMVPIQEGFYIPLYGAASKKPVSVNTFYIDVFPVTNTEYLSFLKNIPNSLNLKSKGYLQMKVISLTGKTILILELQIQKLLWQMFHGLQQKNIANVRINVCLLWMSGSMLQWQMKKK